MPAHAKTDSKFTDTSPDSRSPQRGPSFSDSHAARARRGHPLGSQITRRPLSDLQADLQDDLLEIDPDFDEAGFDDDTGDEAGGEHTIMVSISDLKELQGHGAPKPSDIGSPLAAYQTSAQVPSPHALPPDLGDLEESLEDVAELETLIAQRPPQNQRRSTALHALSPEPAPQKGASSVHRNRALELLEYGPAPKSPALRRMVPPSAGPSTPPPPIKTVPPAPLTTNTTPASPPPPKRGEATRPTQRGLGSGPRARASYPNPPQALPLDTWSGSFPPVDSRPIPPPKFLSLKTTNRGIGLLPFILVTLLAGAAWLLLGL